MLWVIFFAFMLLFLLWGKSRFPRLWSVVVRWIWVVVVLWIGLLGYNVYATYTRHEAALLLPIASVALPAVATLAAGWVWKFRDTARWVRLTVSWTAVALWVALGAVLALGIWGAAWDRGIAALHASHGFRHLPANTVTLVNLFEKHDAAPPLRPPLRLVFTLRDAADIQRLLKTFNQIRPSRGGNRGTGREYLLVLTVKSGENVQPLPVRVLSDPAARPPTARIFIQWKDHDGKVRASEYHSPELYEELKRDGLR